MRTAGELKYCNSFGAFNKTIIPLAFIGYMIVIANSALRGSLAIYHLISNARSFNIFLSISLRIFSVQLTYPGKNKHKNSNKVLDWYKPGFPSTKSREISRVHNRSPQQLHAKRPKHQTKRCLVLVRNIPCL